MICVTSGKKILRIAHQPEKPASRNLRTVAVNNGMIKSRRPIIGPIVGPKNPVIVPPKRAPMIRQKRKKIM